MKEKKKAKKELKSNLNPLHKKDDDVKSALSGHQYVKDTGGTETLLVVDDNEQTRTTIVAMLKKYGYTLLEADSYQKAIEILNAHAGTIHLILSDVVMPGINGPEMVKKLLERQPALKVIFMSGYAGDQIVPDDVFTLLHSQVPFIEKPFTLKEIGLIVRQQLDNKI